MRRPMPTPAHSTAAPRPLNETAPLHTAARPEDALASLCKAAADPLRLRVLRLLRRDAMGVGELCEVLDVRQPALSHHLKRMSAAGLLDAQRDGNHIFYRRRELALHAPFAALQQALFGASDALSLGAALQARRDALQRRREANSRHFFRDNIERFREQRDLIAAPDRYAPAVREAIDTLHGEARRQALEIGPGDGWLLPHLARRYARVIALDNAAAMLDAARDFAGELDNLRFVLGDTRHPALTGLEADLVVLNMVLHHTPDPAATLREAAAALAPGGALLITELCEHAQGWARESCGDLWLGFAPEQLDAWAFAGGLRETASSYLGQRNGFKLQLRLYSAP